MINNYIIAIDGIDKTGKDLIRQYVDILSNHKYTVISRGILSLIAYSNIYNRNNQYNVLNQYNITNIYLTVDEIDWNVRCKITNEPSISYKEHTTAFKNAIDNVTSQGIIIYTFNTSKQTPYEIAKNILKIMETKNEER